MAQVEKDMDNDSYNIKETLQRLNIGKIANVTRPSIETAIKMANTAIFSIIIADFDGLSDFVKVASGVNKDKIPYFISTENRYSWNNTTEHNWVNEEHSYYPLNKVYNICTGKGYDNDNDYNYD